MVFYKLDVDGIRLIVGKIYPEGEILNAETASLAAIAGEVGPAMGSFRSAAAQMTALLNSLPTATTKFSLFAEDAVGGLEAMTSAFLLGDESMAQATSQANRAQTWNSVA